MISSVAFDTIFPPAAFTIPTPQATPEVGTFSSPGQPFGGFIAPDNAINETLQLNAAWSTVTSELKRVLASSGNLSSSFEPALEVLCKDHLQVRSIHDWYLNEVTSRFEQSVARYRRLCSAWSDWRSDDEASAILEQLTRDVDICLLRTVRNDVKQIGSGASMKMLQSLQYEAFEKWCSLVGSSTFGAELQQSLSRAMLHAMKSSSQQLCRLDCWRDQQCRCRFNLDLVPLQMLPRIGIAGELAEKALATAISSFLSEAIVHKRCFQVDWRGRTSCSERLSDWVCHVFAPTIEHAMRRIGYSDVSFTDTQVSVLVETAIAKLGAYRTTAIFDYIKVWPQSTGAIDDIRAFLSLNKINDKVAVCTACEEQVQQRLLHAGASTAEVLGIYVNMINIFRRLDARGVLLEKVSPVIRNYLRARSDAVTVVVESLLADESQMSATTSELCFAITDELENAVQDSITSNRTMDWDDMSWMPEPIDAAVNHRSNKTDDVLTVLLGLFDQDELIKVFDSVLADHLLAARDPEVSRETRLLELLKTRLDAAKLQNAEVMLKDIRDSIQFEKRLRLDTMPETIPTPKEIQAAIPANGTTITELYSRFERRMKRTHFQAVLKLVATKRNDLVFPKRGRLPPEPHEKQQQPVCDKLSTYRILSSISWPQTQHVEFEMPASIASELKEAQEKFISLSGQRKLQWRPLQSKMSVALEFEDRTVEENDVPAARVAVLDVFTATEGAAFTQEQIAEQLNMSEAMVLEIVAYWCSTRVLYQPQSGVYAVLERLDMDSGFEEGLGMDPPAAQSLDTQDALLRENAVMFEAFISNMLSNAGPKEIGGMMGITNMMKMVLPTFTYGDDEVKWLLQQMKGKGLVRDDGDTWSTAG